MLEYIFQIFRKAGMSDPKREAEDLLSDLLGCSRSQLLSLESRLLSDQEQKKAFEWVDRRLKGEPLAYIVGKVQFYDCTIEVNSDVLIPRPETEILVDRIVSFFKGQSHSLKERVLLDLCCGSGCIGIAIKKALPELSVCLSDCSEKAIAVAARNAKRNEVEVTCFLGDLFSPLKEKKIDYFVCNPPYISDNEYLTLDREVKEYEPRLALVSGNTGLEFYEKIAHNLPHYLVPQGRGWLEIGYRQGPAIQNLFQGSPWKNIRFENDWAGHHRFFFLESE